MRTVYHPKRKLFFAACVVGLSWLPAPAQSADDPIDVTVRVQDESGRSIPYVAVWSAIEYDKKHLKGADQYKYLSVDDLWRVTQRYGVSHDVIAQYGDKPIAGIRVPVMVDGAGLFHETLDYAEAIGAENRPARPDRLRFGYTFMKRGYLPGRVEFTVAGSEHRVEAMLTLQRNPGEPLETQSYLQTFARLRFELSDTSRDSALTEENHRRVTSLQERMEAAAQEALAAGDKPAAARIYSRMRYMPTLYFVDGLIAGWNHGDAGSEQARRAIDRAYELNRDDLYVWIQTYLRRRSLLPNPTTEERIAASLWEVEKLIAAKGEAVWPQCLLDQAVGHALLGHYEVAYRLYQEAAQREPAYMDWKEQIRKLKTEMKTRGMAVPAD